MHVWFNKSFSSIAAALNLIRQGDTAGNYRIIYTHTRDHAAPGRNADLFELEPKGLVGKAYLEWCLEFCRSHEIGIFVPGKEAGTISAARARFEAQGTRVLVAATPEVLSLLHDKARFCAEVDLPRAAPAEFRQFENLAEFDAAYAVLNEKYPVLCIKPSQSVYGLGFAVLDKKRNAAQLLMDGASYRVGLDDFRRGLGAQESCRTMLLMQYLEGAEYSVDCVADQGRLMCAVARKKPVGAGEGQTIVVDPVLWDASAKLAADYGLNGNFNAQFREADGKPRLLEINPRMSGGIGMACLAGPNLPYLALRGFDVGFEGLEIAPVRAGIRVGETALPVEFA